MLINREVSLIHNTAKAMEGVSSQMKGAAVVINYHIYRKQDFDKLPYGITLESASAVSTPDGTAF